MKNKDMILRTKYSDRICHWIVAICFFLVALSGLSMFFPSLQWITQTFGTPQLGRILHPFFGILIFLALILLFVHFCKHNILTKTDFIWFKHAKDVLSNDEKIELPISKYNPGQKVLFWGIMWLMIILLITGIIIWRPLFASNFSIPSIRAALFIHSLAGVCLILLILGHIYMAIWVKGSITSMINGLVSKAWAKKHHPLWYDEYIAKEAKTVKENKPS